MTTRSERKQRLETLRAVEVFAECTDAQLERIDGMMTKVGIEEGEELMREGTGGLQFMVVIEGAAEVDVGGTIVAEIGPGSFFGELALLDDHIRRATVTALTPMKLFVLHTGEFAQLLDEAPSVREKVIGAMTARSREKR